MDGRYAPTPSGPLHLGSLRTALVAWLFARAAGSRFAMRIDDLDPRRSRPDVVPAQLRDLTAIGLDWDDVPLYQSTRSSAYAEAIERLEADGRLYPCFCTRAEIRAAASAPHGDLPEGAYPGTCRSLSATVRADRIAAGTPYALRVDAGGPRIAYHDRIRGEVSTVVDDFVVRRADGVAAYQLAVVLDDAAQGVREVVRGADLADSTPRQILLAGWLGLPVPAHAHVGLVLGVDGARLAKRHHAATLADRNEPAARTLALLAHSLGLAAGRHEVAGAAELLDEFDPAAVPAGPVTFG